MPNSSLRVELFYINEIITLSKPCQSKEYFRLGQEGNKMQHGCREIQVDRLKSRSKFKVSAYYPSFRYVCCWSKFICASSNIFLARCLLTWIFYRDEDSISLRHCTYAMLCTTATLWCFLVLTFPPCHRLLHPLDPHPQRGIPWRITRAYNVALHIQALDSVFTASLSSSYPTALSLQRQIALY